MTPRRTLVSALLAVQLGMVPAAAQRVTVYRGATLIDGTGGPAVSDAVMVVEEKRIVSVGPSGEVATPVGADEVDLSGAYLVPGFIDTHVHFMESGRLQDLRYYRMEIPGVEVSKEAEEQWFRERLPVTLARTLCAGVTAAVSLGGPKSLEYGARRLSDEQEIAPRAAVAGGPLAEGDPEALFPDFGGEMCTFQATTPAQVRERVAEFAEDGADLIKLGYLGALPGGLETDAFAHIPFDRVVDRELVARFRESEILITGTITVFEPMAEVLDGSRELLPIEATCGDPEIIATWEIEPENVPPMAKMMAAAFGLQAETLAKNVRLLHEAGVEMAVGSDAAHVGQLHGASFHYELLTLQEAGIPAADLVVAATRNGARLLGREDDLGTLESGKLADFVVLRADPTIDIRNAQQIVGVARGGRYFSQDEILAFGDVD